MNAPGRLNIFDRSPTTKVLVLVDNFDRAKLPVRTATLLEALAEHINPILVAESYYKSARSLKKLRFPYELYGFAKARYDADIRTFSFALKARHAPTAVLSYGWENAQLVYEFYRRQLPVVIFVDHPPPNSASYEGMKWCSQFADAVLLTEELTSYFSFTQSSTFQVYKPVAHARTRRHFEISLFGSTKHKTQQQTAQRLVEETRKAALKLAAIADQSRCDAEVIHASRKFNKELFLEPGDECDEDQVERYLFDSRRCIPRERIVAARLLRRPLEGFHPLIYSTENTAFDEASGEDPLAHFLRNDCPDGAWKHQIIRKLPDDRYNATVKSALHIHMHYPEVLSDLLERIHVNKTTPDLFITTTSDDKKKYIELLLSDRNIKPKLIESDSLNRGRDVWPFISLLESGAFAQYEAVGHLHGKRSPTNKLGDRWREFLWQHLIGGPEPILDSIMFHFNRDDHLGLVIPEDPHLESWGDNWEMSTALAMKMGVSVPLPKHFEFPLGTMFWARPQALAPLLDLDLTTEMIPPEPLEDDGTILHAIERLIPFASAKAGFRMAATYVPGSVW